MNILELPLIPNVFAILFTRWQNHAWAVERAVLPSASKATLGADDGKYFRETPCGEWKALHPAWSPFPSFRFRGGHDSRIDFSGLSLENMPAKRLTCHFLPDDEHLVVVVWEAEPQPIEAACWDQILEAREAFINAPVA